MDLSETANLAAERPELVAKLRQELNAWRLDVGAQMMEANPDYDPALPKKGEKKRSKKRT